MPKIIPTSAFIIRKFIIRKSKKSERKATKQFFRSFSENKNFLYREREHLARAPTPLID